MFVRFYTVQAAMSLLVTETSAEDAADLEAALAEAWAWQAHQQPATAGGASGSGAWPAETWQAAAQAPPVAAAAGQQPAEAPIAAAGQQAVNALTAAANADGSPKAFFFGAICAKTAEARAHTHAANTCARVHTHTHTSTHRPSGS